MKKSELTQLTQIIEILVAKEVRKQLPGIIAETFQNMMGRQVVAEETRQPVQQPQPIQEEMETEETTLKQSLRELFAGTPVMKTQPAGPRTPRQLAKDPVLNSILNQTRPFNSQEKMAMGGGPSVMMAMAQMPVASPMSPMSMTGVGEMMPEAEMPSFARMPTMPGVSPGVPLAQPPTLVEGQESTHIPAAAMGEVSALDVARAGMVPNPAVTQALTNFDRMRKILQQSKGPRH